MPPPSAILKKKTSSKNPPIFSSDFLIQNHGDIACGILIILVLATMVPATSPYFLGFFSPRHNVTNFDSFSASSSSFFNYGYKDLAMIFSYTLICITIHAVWKEYILDKFYKKLRLSKTKNSNFFESGQLILFYIISVILALILFNNEGYFQLNLQYLWRDYPYIGMTLWTKIYFIIQLSYWLHQYPELYLQRIRKEDIPIRIIYTSLFLITILYGYLTRFWRITIVLLTIHYFIEIFNHLSRLTYCYANSKTAKLISNYLFKIWNFIFIFGRLVSIILAWLTFWFGLKSSSIDKISTSFTNFNTQTVRLFTLITIGALQFWLVWNFIQFHMKRRRERRNARSTAINSPKLSTKLKQKQQDLTNSKSENGGTVEQSVRGNKKGN